MFRHRALQHCPNIQGKRKSIPIFPVSSKLLQKKRVLVLCLIGKIFKIVLMIKLIEGNEFGKFIWRLTKGFDMFKNTPLTIYLYLLFN